ncbi:Gag-Pol polyprotein [Gossypium australe]|uniref:Gag-Pol polyprotein n=1 Tax=Gossypium australe TaxID=47621 RepID=A0A5B6WT19_9ROSI|nr:Gag-Pol polyprotein [Gossypium australe]
MTVTEYEQEFDRLSKYDRECVSTEAIMCKRFEDGLNEDIMLLVGILELKEFIVLVERAYKAEELSKEKRKAEFETRDSRKRLMNKPFQSSSKKSRDLYTRSNASAGYPNRERVKQYSGSKAQTTSIVSVGNARSNRPECQHCGRRHPDECRMNNRACFKYGSQDDFIRDCPEIAEKDNFQNTRSSNIAARGRLVGNTGNVTSSKGVTKDSAVRSEARAPARAYAIRAREDVSSPDVITGTFSLYDTNELGSNKNLPVESTEFVIKVSNPLGKYVLVDKVCKSCPLMIRCHCFPAGLMLLLFDEFDVILGMDWLTLHDVVVNCRRKTIKLKCQNNEILRIEPDESGELPTVISSMSAQRYVRKGYEAFLAYVLNTKVSKLKIESVPIVCEYPDVFPKELPGLPSIREVEFAIDLVPGTLPILMLRIEWLQPN